MKEEKYYILKCDSLIGDYDGISTEILALDNSRKEKIQKALIFLDEEGKLNQEFELNDLFVYIRKNDFEFHPCSKEIHDFIKEKIKFNINSPLYILSVAFPELKILEE